MNDNWDNQNRDVNDMFFWAGIYGGCLTLVVIIGIYLWRVP